MALFRRAKKQEPCYSPEQLRQIQQKMRDNDRRFQEMQAATRLNRPEVTRTLPAQPARPEPPVAARPNRLENPVERYRAPTPGEQQRMIAAIQTSNVISDDRKAVYIQDIRKGRWIYFVRTHFTERGPNWPREGGTPRQHYELRMVDPRTGSQRDIPVHELRQERHMEEEARKTRTANRPTRPLDETKYDSYAAKLEPQKSRRNPSGSGGVLKSRKELAAEGRARAIDRTDATRPVVPLPGDRAEAAARVEQYRRRGLMRGA